MNPIEILVIINSFIVNILSFTPDTLNLKNILIASAGMVFILLLGYAWLLGLYTGYTYVKLQNYLKIFTEDLINYDYYSLSGLPKTFIIGCLIFVLITSYWLGGSLLLGISSIIATIFVFGLLIGFVLGYIIFPINKRVYTLFKEPITNFFIIGFISGTWFFITVDKLRTLTSMYNISYSVYLIVISVILPLYLLIWLVIIQKGIKYTQRKNLL